MDILGIGGWELLLIAIIAMVVLGPERMLKHSFEAGRWLRKLSTYSRDALAMLEAQAREIDDGALVDATKNLSDLKALGTELQSMGTKLISGTISDIKLLGTDVQPLLALTDSATPVAAAAHAANTEVRAELSSETAAVESAASTASTSNGTNGTGSNASLLSDAAGNTWPGRTTCAPACCGPECLVISRITLPPLAALMYRSARPHLQ